MSVSGNFFSFERILHLSALVTKPTSGCAPHTTPMCTENHLTGRAHTHIFPVRTPQRIIRTFPVWPHHTGRDRVRPRPTWARLCYQVRPVRVRPDRVMPGLVEARRVAARRVGRAQNFALFFPSPAPIFVSFFLSLSGGLLVSFFLSLGVFSWNFGGVFRVFALGLSCESPRRPARKLGQSWTENLLRQRFSVHSGKEKEIETQTMCIR